VAIAIGTNQCAVVSLFTLWMTAWLRDVAGYDRASAANGLFWAALALIAGYFFFGRLGDARARRGLSPCRSSCRRRGLRSPCWRCSRLALPPAPCSSGPRSSFSAPERHSRIRSPRAASRARWPARQHGAQHFTFMGIFLGQWATGAVLNRFPSTATGYDPRGYAYALGALALIQAGGLAWLWAGRRAVLTPR
jgi:hypothetical protein